MCLCVFSSVVSGLIKKTVRNMTGFSVYSADKTLTKPNELYGFSNRSVVSGLIDHFVTQM